jgi:hypothetical protein
LNVQDDCFAPEGFIGSIIVYKEVGFDFYLEY